MSKKKNNDAPKDELATGEASASADTPEEQLTSPAPSNETAAGDAADDQADASAVKADAESDSESDTDSEGADAPADLPDEIDSTPEGAKKPRKKYKLKTFEQCKEAAVDFGLIPPPNPDEEGIDKKEKKKRKKDFEQFKERLVHDIELAKKRGPIRWKAAAAIPFVFVTFLLIGWLWGDSMAEEAIRQSFVSSLGPSTRVEMDDVSFSIFGPSIAIENLRVYQPTKSLYLDQEEPDFELLEEQIAELDEDYASDDWSEIVAMGNFKADVEFWPLLAGRVWISQVDMRDALIQPDNINPMDAPKPGSDAAKGGGGSGSGTGSGASGTGEGAAEEEAPEDSPVDSLNEMIDEFEEWRNDPWVQRGIEYAKDWRASRGDAEGEVTEKDLRGKSNLPASPAYIRQAMAKNQKPEFLLREIVAGQVDVKFGRSTHKHKLGSSGDDGLLTVRNVSSNPALWGEFIEADGKLGSALQASVNYSNREEDANKPSQVLVSLTSGALEGVFGKGLKDVQAGLLLFPDPEDLPGGMTSTDVFRLKGSLEGGSVDTSLWIPRRGGFGALGFSMRDVPLDQIADGLGDLPFTFQPGMTGSITTCTADGKRRYSPEDPASCFVIAKGGIKLALSLELKGPGLLPKPGRSVLGIPGQDFCDFFNAWAQEQGVVEFRFALDTQASGSPFKLLYPGDRWLVDSLLDSATISGDRLSDWTGGSLKFQPTGDVNLRSVDLEGQPRLAENGAPLTDDNKDRESDSLADLRAQAVMKDLKVSEFFGSPVNATLPEARLIIRFFNSEGEFSPSLDGGQRGIADAVLSNMDASSETLNGWLDFGISFEQGGDVDLTSIDPDGSVRTWESEGANDSNMENMRASAQLKGLKVRSFFGVGSSVEVKDVLIGLSVLDRNENFSPKLERGSRKPLVMAVASDMQWELKRFTGSNSIMGMKLEDDARVALLPRKDDLPPADQVPPADGPSLANLTFDVQLVNAQVDPSKQGSKQLLAKRWNAYMEKRDGKIPAEVILFDAKESFSPEFKLDEDALVKDMSEALELKPEDFADLLPEWAKRNGLVPENIPNSVEEARKKAEEEARKKAEAEKARLEEEARKKAEAEKARIEEERRKQQEKIERERKAAEEAARKAAEKAAEEAKKKAKEILPKKINPFG